ncbi:MAG: FHA domain-containing protein, partial [Coriobacteriales bacterium]|nr:FHA domain-containing protein [Coriobacteriales bacterium]
MIDVSLFIGRRLLGARLVLFRFAEMRTGVGLVRNQGRKDDAWTVAIQHGPRELRGVKIQVAGPVVVGRSPGADIVIGASYVSGRHARFTRLADNLI